MCILSDTTLHELLPELIREPDYSMINPASVDIRIGRYVQYEDQSAPHDTTFKPYLLQPKEFVLVETYEYISVPNGYAVELKLKSTRAREGYDHSLAFWVDPGWTGILTMEVVNNNRLQVLELRHAMRFAQIIVHKLDRPAANPYSGKYQNASMVELPK